MFQESERIFEIDPKTIKSDLRQGSRKQNTQDQQKLSKVSTKDPTGNKKQKGTIF